MNISFIQTLALFNKRIDKMELTGTIPRCDKDATAVMIRTAIAVKKDPLFRSLPNKDICFALIYSYYWVQYPYSSPWWLTDDFLVANTNQNADLCRALIEQIQSVRPHVTLDEMYGGFDIIVIITVHGETCDEGGVPFHPMHMKAADKGIAEPYPFTLMEAVPCGITNFNMSTELALIMDYVEDLKSHEHFLQELQGRLCELKFEKHSDSDDFHGYKYDPEFVEFHQCTRNFNIVPHTGGYLERVYEYDKSEPGSGFNVAYAKGPFQRGDNLMRELTPLEDRKRIEFTRTQLLTLLRSRGYRMPLIIDLTCGCFDDEVPKHLVKKHQELAAELGLSGGRRHSLKKRRILKKTKTRRHLLF